MIWPRIFNFEQLFLRYPKKYPEKCYNSCYEVCLFAWQTDSWSSLRKNKFHLSWEKIHRFWWLSICSFWSNRDYESRCSINAGFSKTSSGETLNCPAKSGIFLSKRRDAKSKGQAPLRLSLAVELMWLAMRLISSCVYLCILRPFGITYRMYSWFFSKRAFWFET